MVDCLFLALPAVFGVVEFAIDFTLLLSLHVVADLKQMLTIVT